MIHAASGPTEHPTACCCPPAMIVVLVLVLVLAMTMMMMMLIDFLVPSPPDAPHRLRQSTLRSGGPFSHNSTPAMALGNARYGILLTCTDSSL
jgi:hypothetical protein